MEKLLTWPKGGINLFACLDRDVYSKPSILKECCSGTKYEEICCSRFRIAGAPTSTHNGAHSNILQILSYSGMTDPFRKSNLLRLVSIYAERVSIHQYFY